MIACNWVSVRSTAAESIHSKHNAGCPPGLHYDALASIASAVCRLKLVSLWQVGLKIFDIRSVILSPLSVSTMLKLGGTLSMACLDLEIFLTVHA
jgi:hypothetical protein